ncbi:MAG: ferrochelatase [Calditrichia bacterium]
MNKFNGMDINKNKRGILLTNLGSPSELTQKAVRVYLKEFLMDKRVLDLPYPLRWMIVHLFVLPFRPRKTIDAYSAIWWPKGSPLLIMSEEIQKKLRAEVEFPVALGMRYGKPSIASAIKQLLRQDVREIFLLPLFPHYAMSTFESAVEKVREELQPYGDHIRLVVKSPYYADPQYVEILVQTTESVIKRPYEHLLFSYHGIPERHVKKTDPTGSHCLFTPDCCVTPSPAHKFCYRHQVLKTTEAFVKLAGIPREKYSVSFQSRFGRDKWLQPSTESELVRLAQAGIKKLVVICPSFVTDCLETLEEIGQRGKELFLQAGGEEFQLIPCLNDNAGWLQVLKKWCEQQ